MMAPLGKDGSPTNLVTKVDPTSNKAAVKVAITKALSIVAKQSTIEGRWSPTRSYLTGIRQQPINNNTEPSAVASRSKNRDPSRRNADRTTEISLTSVRIRARRSALPTVSSSATMSPSLLAIQPSAKSGRMRRETASTPN